MFAWLKKWVARSSPLNMEGAFATILTKKQREAISALSPDRRRMVEFAAQTLGVSQRELLVQVGKVLGLPVVGEVPAFPAKRCPQELRQKLFAGGAIPFCEGGLIRGVIAVDPGLISETLQQTKLPVALAPWGEIKSAWDQSGHELDVTEAQSEYRKEAPSPTRALEEIIREVRKYAGTEAWIKPRENSLEYSFRARSRAEWGVDGREATGTVDESVAAQVAQLLARATSEPECLAPVRQALDMPLLAVTTTSQLGMHITWRKRVVIPDAVPEKVAQLHVITGGADREVVLIEDNPSIASVLRKIIATTKVRCRWYPDGAQALEALTLGECKPSVLLCDIHMPEMDGITFVRRVRMLPAFQSTPIIMLTSDEALEAELTSLKSGADAFVGKSEDPKVLLGYLERMLERSAQKPAA